MEFVSLSRNETKEIAKKFSSSVKEGDIICLDGDLGAGKTAFVSGFAEGLGYKGYVTSPTFTLVNEYEAEKTIYHFDVYRIDECDDMFDIGLDDYLFSDGVCIIEWAERIKSVLPENVINIEIKKDIEKGEDFRKITIEGGDFK